MAAYCGRRRKRAAAAGDDCKIEGGILPKDVTLEFYSTQATDEAGEEEMAAAYLENLQTPDPAKDG